MPGEATRWALVNTKKKLEAAEAEIVRLRDHIQGLEGQVYDLGGDPKA